MVKRYSFEQLEGFVKGYSMTERHQGNFAKAISKAMVELYQIVSEGKDLGKIWNRKLATNYHTWLSFDLETRELVYDTGARDEEWSGEIVDNLFEQYDLEKIRAFADLKQTEEFKERYRILRDYYHNSYHSKGYYSNTFAKGLSGLTEQEWNNVLKKGKKYVQKVFDAFYSEPLYRVGDIVSLRLSRELTSDKYGMKAAVLPYNVTKVLVLSSTEPILNARKGAKRYKVAPIGGSNVRPLWIEEAFLKKYRKKVNKRKSRNV
jgi:hypothetical protein